MFNANKILGMLMESGMSRSGQSRVERVAAGSGQSAGSSGDQNRRSSGSGDQSPGGSGGGFADMARSMLGGGGDQSRESRQSPGGSGGGLAGLAGSLFGGGGRTAGGVSGGAMGILGALAGMAMKHFGSGQGTAQAGSGQPGGERAAQPGLAEAPTPYAAGAAGAAADDDTRATVMIRAMIAAARADGEIGPEEKQRILGRLEEAGADPEEQAFVRDEMAKPADVNAIVSAVDSPHTAIEVYAASLFAIDVNTPAETAHMQKLAQGLRLDPGLVRELHANLEAPPPR